MNVQSININNKTQFAGGVIKAANVRYMGDTAPTRESPKSKVTPNAGVSSEQAAAMRAYLGPSAQEKADAALIELNALKAERAQIEAQKKIEEKKALQELVATLSEEQLEVLRRALPQTWVNDAIAKQHSKDKKQD